MYLEFEPDETGEPSHGVYDPETGIQQDTEYEYVQSGNHCNFYRCELCGSTWGDECGDHRKLILDYKCPCKKIRSFLELESKQCLRNRASSLPRQKNSPGRKPS